MRSIIYKTLMTLSVEYVSCHLFVGQFFGQLDHGYFCCYDGNCPFSVKTVTAVVSGKTIASSCEHVVVPVHCHEKIGGSISQVRKIMAEQLEFIKQNPEHPQAVAFSAQHRLWKQIAHDYSKRYKDHLIVIENVKVYRLDHPEKTAKQVKDECCVAINPRSINNMMKLVRSKRGITTNITTMVVKKLTTCLAMMATTSSSLVLPAPSTSSRTRR